MLEERDLHSVWWDKLWERDHSEDVEVDGRTVLKWILKQDARAWTALL
jgi:hypothetical protein